MTKNQQAFAAFLFVLLVMVASQSSHAAYVATPSVDGLSAGIFKPLTTPALTGSNFVATGKVLINGKLVPIPGYIPPASTAAAAAKNSLWLNPWLIGASLLAWAGDAGLESDYVNGGGWMVTFPGVGTASCTTSWAGVGYGNTWGEACTAAIARLPYQCPNVDPSAFSCVLPGGVYGSYGEGYVTYNRQKYCGSPECTGGFTLGQYMYDYMQYTVGWLGGTEGTSTGTSEPATSADFDALPAPSPQALAELAPQVGVPVDDPVYEFGRVEIGQPYERADGTTVQPMATVSPAGSGQVTVDTYEQPLTDTSGVPLVDPAAPQDTPDSPPAQPTLTQCDKFPNTLGCANLDVPTDLDLPTQAETVNLISPITVGGAGSCPQPLQASFLGQTIEMKFDPLCTFAGTLRPLVLTLAWLSAGVIFIGGVRNG